MINLINISKKIKNRWILKDITLTLPSKGTLIFDNCNINKILINYMDLIKDLNKSSLVIMASHDPRTLINHGINIYLGDLEKKS